MSRQLRIAILGALVALISACGGGSSSAAQATSSPSTATPSSAAASTATPSQNPGSGGGQLDPEVSPPAGFPANVPVYSGARLTTGNSFTASGNTTYGMEWETLDSVSQVQAYYSSQLAQGDWSLTYSSNTGGGYNAGFASKSNSKITGILVVAADNGLTKITLSFVVLG